MTTENKIGVSQYSFEAGIVRENLSALQPGEQITYEALTAIVGIDVLKFRNVINMARKRLLKEEQKVYQSIHGVGLVRLNDQQIVGKGFSTTKKIGRIARKGIQIVSAANYDALTQADKVKHNVSLTVLNMMQHATGRSALSQLENVVTKEQKRLPLHDTLALLAGGK